MDNTVMDNNTKSIPGFMERCLRSDSSFAPAEMEVPVSVIY